MERNSERIANTIEVKIGILKSKCNREKEHRKQLDKDYPDAYVTGFCNATIVRLESEIAYLEDVVGELRYG